MFYGNDYLAFLITLVSLLSLQFSLFLFSLLPNALRDIIKINFFFRFFFFLYTIHFFNIWVQKMLKKPQKVKHQNLIHNLNNKGEHNHNKLKRMYNSFFLILRHGCMI